jgi:hypothetical protein
MLPSIRPSTSGIVNDLVEIRQLKSLVPTVQRLLRLLSGIPRSRGTFRTLARTYSDAYLQWSFNIAPVIADIEAVLHVLTASHDRLKRLRAGSGNVLTKHFQASLEDSYKDKTITCSGLQCASWCVAPPTVDASCSVEYTRRQFNATIQYVYSVNAPDGLASEIGSFLDVLGVNLNPSIIWNAIPWTFVVDWFANISSWLDQLKVRNIEPVTVILDYCWSISLVRSVKASMSVIEGTAFEINESAYFRQAVTPDLYHALQVSGLNPKEFSLGLALGLSRLKS